MSEQRHIRKIVRKQPAEELNEARRRADGVKKTSLGALSTRAVAENLRRASEGGTQSVGVSRDYSPHSKPRAVEGFVTLSELAAKAGIQAQLARLWLKKAEIKKPAAGWRWKVDSRELTRVRKVLGRVLSQEPT